MDPAARTRFQARLAAVFARELQGHVATLECALLALEKARRDGMHDAAALERFLRAAHSLKGSARAAGVAPVEELAHAIEDAALLARRVPSTGMPRRDDGHGECDGEGDVIGGAQAVEPSVGGDPVFAALFAAVDGLAHAHTRLSAGEPIEAGPESPLGAALRKVTRVSTGAPAARPDAPGRERPTVAIDEAPSCPGESRQAGLPADPRSRREALPEENAWVRVSVARLEALTASATELSTVLWRLRHESPSPPPGMCVAGAPGSEVLRRCEALAREIGDESRSLRLAPLEETFAGLRRLARDVARTMGKDVRLETTGDTVELERSLLDRLADPLRHLVRNAIDHGIEDAATRRAAGKPAVGRVVVSALQRGESVEVSVSDDGGGLDLDALARKASAHGLEVPEAPEARARLVFLSGVSTAPRVTTLSGRGVGLDVVKSLVDELHGVVDIAFEPGRGTCFVMRLPASLSSLRCVRVEAGGVVWAFASSNVERVARPCPSSYVCYEGRAAVRDESGVPVPLVPLVALVGARAGAEAHAHAHEGDARPVLYVRTAGGGVAFLVDAFLDEEKSVVDAAPRRLAGASYLAGVTRLPSGRIVPVLSAAELVKAAAARVHDSACPTGAPQERGISKGKPPLERRVTRDAAGIQSSPPSRRAARVLVVDDSLTTRTLHKGLLEEAGYEVETAIDGVDALALLSRRGYDLVASDVEMPRLDGMGLVRALRAGGAGSAVANIPFVLVSTREHPQARALGTLSGADAYVTKASVGRGDLLGTLEAILVRDRARDAAPDGGPP